jgi:hypothetical protein
MKSIIILCDVRVFTKGKLRNIKPLIFKHSYLQSRIKPVSRVRVFNSSKSLLQFPDGIKNGLPGYPVE